MTGLSLLFMGVRRTNLVAMGFCIYIASVSLQWSLLCHGIYRLDSQLRPITPTPRMLVHFSFLLISSSQDFQLTKWNEIILNVNYKVAGKSTSSKMIICFTEWVKNNIMQTIQRLSLAVYVIFKVPVFQICGYYIFYGSGLYCLGNRNWKNESIANPHYEYYWNSTGHN